MIKNTLTPKTLKSTLISTALLTLAGCSYFDTGLEKPMTCPTVRVLQHSDKLVQFNGTPTLDNIVIQGQIQSVTGTCYWRNNQLDVILNVEAYLTKGQKSNPKTDYKSPLYVTVTDTQKNIIQRLTTDVENNWNGRIGTISAPVTLGIPLKNINYVDDVVLYVGYNVTKTELEFIRKNSK